ncbi:DNA topoisomerase III, partial [bacterium]|nr:DNA topoisomerase III [bacterium]
MAKSLIIAEKPSVAKDIAKVLGSFTDHSDYMESDRYVISWALGHLVEFVAPEEIDAKYKAWKLEDLPILPKIFQFRAKDKCKSRISVISKLLKRKDVEFIINACDAGREGELIFRELLDFCKCRKPTQRLWLQSMTPDAIREAFTALRPGEDYNNLGDAAKCRSEADWLIGINATRALTKRLRTRSEKVSWSAGRVQTPTLAMLAERELAILSFRPTPFWRLKATFKAPYGSAQAHEYEGTWYDPSFKESEDSPRKKDWIVTEEHLQAIMNAVRGQIGHASETRKNRQESAPALFDLTTLQREANKRFGMSAQSTLAVAQRLYESHKLITYPRTASKCLPSDYRTPVNEVLSIISGYAGLEANGRLDYPAYAECSRYLLKNGLKNASRIFDDSKITDHFAIIPTKTKATGKLREDEAKIYDLIVRRFLAAFYPPAKWIDIERDTVVNGHHFRSAGKALSVPGWRAVYGR